MPDRKPFLALLQEALENIREEQLFNDERGFQGSLLQELGRRLPDGGQPEDPMLQQEYQKRIVPLENLELSERMGIILSILILLRCSFFLRHSLALCLQCSVLGRCLS